MAESPSMGVLQRAMSKRIGLSVPAPRNADPLDASEHPEHIQDESLDSSVTGSSVKAMSTFLCSIEYQNSAKNVVLSSAPAGEGDSDGDGDGGGDDVGEGQGGKSDDEPDDGPPPTRGIVSAQGISGGMNSVGFSGSSGSAHSTVAEEEGAGAWVGEEGGKRWEPNMQLSLAEFDQDSVSYLAEGAMCQCFLSHKIPSSMNVPAEGDGSTTTTTGSSNTTTNQAAAAVFECARKKGVIIKTPTEGPNQQASENDLIVESLVLRELNHPNIVGILGGGKTHTGASFICLEYLSGGTLKDRLDKCGGGLGLGPAMKYGVQLASALSYMHDGGLPGIILMHRDLKPDNIGFSSGGAAKLMDFGLAKIIHRKLRCGSVKYNMTGETGSPRYMSPEVATSQPYNEKADVWSFMVIVWQMVSGRLPFAGMNMEMYLDRVCHGGERPLLQNQWPDDFKNLLRSSWERDSDMRPSFREIHAVLAGMNSDMNKRKHKKKSSFFSMK